MTSIALFPLNIVLFPDGPLPLRIFETRYVDMVRRCMREDSAFGVALIREGHEVGPAETYDVGTFAKVIDFHQLADGLLGLSCVGRQRFRILERSVQPDGLNLAEVDLIEAEPLVPIPERHARLAQLLQTRIPAQAQRHCPAIEQQRLRCVGRCRLELRNPHLQQRLCRAGRRDGERSRPRETGRDQTQGCAAARRARHAVTAQQ